MESRRKEAKDVFVEYFGKGRRIVELMVSAETGAEGLLEELAEAFEQVGARILELNSSHIGGKTRVFVFADFSEAEVEPVDFLDMLRRRGLRANLSSRNYGGYIVDQFGFPVTSAGGTFRVLVFPAGLLSRTFRRLQEQLGSPGRSLLFHLGEEFGKIMFEGQRRMLEVDDEAVAMSLLDLYSSLGMGVVEVVQADWRRGRFRIRIWENYESLHGAGCDFTRGFLAGVLSSVLKRPVSVFEARCRSRGDPYCEFVAD